jgi:hypothetical protein
VNDYRIVVRDTPTSTEARTWDFNPQVTDLRWKSRLPGGDDTMDVGIGPDGGEPVYGYLRIPFDVPLLSHIELWRGMTLLWTGRVMDRTFDGPDIAGLSCEGYSATLYDETFITTPTVYNDMPGGQLVQLLLRYSQWITANRFGFLELPGPPMSDPDGKRRWLGSVGSVLDEVAKLGSGGVPLDWIVNRDRQLTFIERRPPAQPTYHVPHERGITSYSESGRGLYGEVTVGYWDDDNEQETVTADGFTDRWKAQRATTIKAEAGLSSAELESIGKAFLTNSSTPEVRASVRRGRGRGLETPSGAERPAWAADAGEWFKLGNKPGQICVSANHNASSDEHQFELGAPLRSIVNAIRETRRLGEAYRDGVNPVTSQQKGWSS